MFMTQDANVTQMLRDWRAGDAAAGERLLPIVYAELHRRAAAAMRREDAGHTFTKCLGTIEVTGCGRQPFHGAIKLSSH